MPQGPSFPLNGGHPLSVLLGGGHHLHYQFLESHRAPRTLSQGSQRALCSLFFKNTLFIYLFLAAFGLCCCTRAFSSWGERGLLFVVVHGFLIAVASLCCGARALGARASVVVACGLVVVARGLVSCGARA